MLPVQISQNPKLTKLNLPMLEAIGGPLIIQNNSALATLESLEHLTAVNATGKIPSVTIPGLQVPCPCLLMSRDISTQPCWKCVIHHGNSPSDCEEASSAGLTVSAFPQRACNSRGSLHVFLSSCSTG